jgi:hypothetical protein
MSASKNFETSIRTPAFSEIKKDVIYALKKFGKLDVKLLEYSIDEYAFPHHIACYLEEKFSRYGYDVDCEYNKVGTEGQVKKGNSQDRDISPSKKKGLRPDIIIHQRGNERENNLLVIEIKKEENRNISRDRKKLRDFTLQEGGQLQYKYGLLLLISRKTFTVRGEFFENGKRSPEKIDKFLLIRGGDDTNQ